MYNTLVSPDILLAHIGDANWRVVDTRFWLADPDKGRRDYEYRHIPGAVYAHLDEDLSGPILPQKTGRHPLPNVGSFVEKLGSWGIGAETQVVIYDDSAGAIAARLWWMLHWLGHSKAAVIDGGWGSWLARGYPTTNKIQKFQEKTFIPKLNDKMLKTTQDILAFPVDEVLVDSRSVERFSGNHEPIDPVAGHIPGAVHAFHGEVVDQDGFFRTPAALRTHFLTVLGGTPPDQTTFYCGSGVTAARNILAMEHAGLPGSKLYAGSWSEWITDPSRKIGTTPWPTK